MLVRSGVLPVDKPAGLTSHAVVARARRALGTRAVGHAGTLDPAATGLLLLAFGEGTKLVRHLTGLDKAYRATIQLGSETDSLDADGAVCATAPVPELSTAAVRAAVAAFVGGYPQEVPRVSAVKVAGKALYKRTREGETLTPPVRQVVLHDVTIESVDPKRHQIALELCCGKGFYVRSFARDLAKRLGTLGHLVALRRTRVGHWALSRAVPPEAFDNAVSEGAWASLLPWCEAVEDAWRGPRAALTPPGVVDAGHGRAVCAEHVAWADPNADSDSGEVVYALLADYDGAMVCLAHPVEGGFKVVRGLRPRAPLRQEEAPRGSR